MIYAFACESCGHHFEKQLMLDDRSQPLDEPCPVCSKDTIKRNFMGEGFSFQDSIKLGMKKPDSEFRNLLGKIKKDHHGGGQIDKYT